MRPVLKIVFCQALAPSPPERMHQMRLATEGREFIEVHAGTSGDLPDESGRIFGKPALMQGQLIEQREQAVNQRPGAVAIAPRRKIIQQIEQQNLASDCTQAAFFLAGKTAGPGSERCGRGREEGAVALKRRLLLQHPAETRHSAGVRKQDDRLA